jgi:hypothetical protein
VSEDVTQLVVANLPDVGRPPAERRHTDDRVGRRAARDLDTGAHGRIEIARARLVDELHGAFRQPVVTEKLLAGVGQHVHERVADTDDVELSHVAPSLAGHR